MEDPEREYLDMLLKQVLRAVSSEPRAARAVVDPERGDDRPEAVVEAKAWLRGFLFGALLANRQADALVSGELEFGDILPYPTAEDLAQIADLVEDSEDRIREAWLR